MNLINKKKYKINNTKKHLKQNCFLFFFSGSNKSSKNRLLEKKKLKNLKLNYYKVNNKITIKLIKNSVKYFINFLIKGSLFLIKFDTTEKILIKSLLIYNFYLLFPIIITIKLNNKIYSFFFIKNMYCFSYFQNKQFIQKFCILRLKSYNFFSK